MAYFEVSSLSDFYSLMFQSRDVRRQIVERVLKGIAIRQHFVASLQSARASLASNCWEGTRLRLSLEDNPQADINIDVADEIKELDMDLAFLSTMGEEDKDDDIETFNSTLEQFHSTSPQAYREELEGVVSLMCSVDHFTYFFTDRDGTLKPYASTYPTSIQPSYSGTMFSFTDRDGTLKPYASTYPTSIQPSYSGTMFSFTDRDGTLKPYASTYPTSIQPSYSGGREWYLDESRVFRDKSIPAEDLALLDAVHQRLKRLLQLQKYEEFKWLGSGLQKHYGQLTVARQDVYRSVPPARSLQWLKMVEQVVGVVDNERLAVVDSGTDIRIHIKGHDSQGSIFNKGHGIRFLAKLMRFDLSSSEASILVCGDSESDLPMLHTCLSLNPKGTYTVWVTQNNDLRSRVVQMCLEAGQSSAQAAFASSPPVLLGAMAQATIREITLRPPSSLQLASQEPE